MFLSECSTNSIKQAAQSIAAGHLVAFPTETVYGLGADATNESAVAKIYQAKGRPSDHPLIVHIASMGAIGDWTSEVSSYAINLARDFWPGPMTLIFRRSELAEDFITGNQETVALRVPNQPVALALLKEFEKLGGRGIAAPSANRFGALSPTTAQAVKDELANYLDPKNDLILDGGPCQVGVESTIIDCTTNAPQILRLGAITREMIQESTGLLVLEDEPTRIRVSGSLESHYSPNATVLLDVLAQSGEGFIAMDSIQTPAGAIRLASPSSIESFARELYAALRFADAQSLRYPTRRKRACCGNSRSLKTSSKLKTAYLRNSALKEISGNSPINFSRPGSSAISNTTATDSMTAAHWCTNFTPAISVPPVASTSSISRTRSPGRRTPSWISRTSLPYSNP
jgi:L-threonylcarbamoyladenylate synthase